MLVNRGLINDELELRERMFVEAFAGGFAEKIHFDSLVDMRNVLVIAACQKDDKPIIQFAQAMSIPLQAIRARHARTGKFGATGEELKLMRVFCDIYRDWWLRQSVGAYEKACDELQSVIYQAKEAA